MNNRPSDFQLIIFLLKILMTSFEREYFLEIKKFTVGISKNSYT